ncbi:hypothetical protein EST38_g2410 [Candolleomyces aberdarensis]|uniref:Uncharacterized protein n=1 Tax=Candolleomyces aberdarensis TaxID=2316362 RepID=A0A4Q2DTJ9_9AGAR|nr:hypothetical protein EST38_g2410 [Candolleomyces aberdarensis]
MTLSSSSRFTTAVSNNQLSSRHPLSLFTLSQSLQSAVSAKRYTCAHLLALRFSEDEEEYWENGRSMMELLTSTFCDEAARLGEALEDVERQRMRDQNPTPAPDGEREFARQQQRLEQELEEEEDSRSATSNMGSLRRGEES